jgi:hypothetical protein
VYAAVEQAMRDAAESMLPMVAHRKNRTDWMVTMKADTWLILAQAYEACQDLLSEEKAGT